MLYVGHDDNEISFDFIVCPILRWAWVVSQEFKDRMSERAAIFTISSRYMCAVQRHEQITEKLVFPAFLRCESLKASIVDL